MEYVMNSVEKELFNLIDQEGVKAPIASTIRALIEYAHTMSDMGLKEKAIEAMNVSNSLKEIWDVIESK